MGKARREDRDDWNGPFGFSRPWFGPTTLSRFKSIFGNALLAALLFTCAVPVGHAQVKVLGLAKDADTPTVHVIHVRRASIRTKSLPISTTTLSTGFVVGRFHSPKVDGVLEVTRRTESELGLSWVVKNLVRRSRSIRLPHPIGPRFYLLAGFDLKRDGFEDLAIVDQSTQRLRWFLIENPAGPSPRVFSTFLHGKAGDQVALLKSRVGRHSTVRCVTVRHNLPRQQVTIRTRSVAPRTRSTMRIPWKRSLGTGEVLRLQRGQRDLLALMSPLRKRMVLMRRRAQKIVRIPRKRCDGTLAVLEASRRGMVSVLELCPTGRFFVVRANRERAATDTTMPSFHGTLPAQLIGVRPLKIDEVLPPAEQFVPTATPTPPPTETATPTETPTHTPTATYTSTPHSWNLVTVLGQQYILLDGTLYQWDGISKGPEANQGALLSQLSAVTFSAGSGTVGDPYLISFCLQLQAMSNALNAHYALAHDIDCTSSTTWNGNQGFTPVGSSTSGTEFTGSLDGRGHTVRGLTVNRPSDSNIGLFGYTHYATIQNLTLESVTMNGTSNVAGLVGYKSFGTVSGCRTTGAVTGREVVGGLAGYNAGGVIEFSSSSVTVSQNTASGWVGGLVGINFGWSNPTTVLRDSFATGSVTATGDQVGGLVGGILYSNSLITRCYATGTVTGRGSVGGLTGSIQHWALVSNSYATGAVSGTELVGGFMGLSWFGMAAYNFSLGTSTGTTNIGGFAGRNGRNGSYTANYWNTTTSGRATSPIGAGLTSAQMQSAASFTGWDFTSTWMLSPELLGGFPTIRSIPPQP